jgi:hypothetical protein
MAPMCARRIAVNLAGLFIVGIVVTAGCGGAAEEAPVAAAPPAGESPAVAVANEETRASSGTAAQGGACDYGGADSFTCSSGLECCYGEHARPDGYGSCQPECNWD